MKTNKKLYITIMLLLTISVISYGFIINNKSFSVAKINYNSQTLTPEQEILGFWVLENDSTTKIQFLANGELKYYEDNILKYTDSYTISNECGGHVSEDESVFLKTIDGEYGTVSCDAIMNGVYAPNSTTLTLMNDNGKLAIYNRQ